MPHCYIMNDYKKSFNTILFFKLTKSYIFIKCAMFYSMHTLWNGLIKLINTGMSSHNNHFGR